jgi:hypothetical protein
MSLVAQRLCSGAFRFEPALLPLPRFHAAPGHSSLVTPCGVLFRLGPVRAQNGSIPKSDTPRARGGIELWTRHFRRSSGDEVGHGGGRPHRRRGRIGCASHAVPNADHPCGVTSAVRVPVHVSGAELRGIPPFAAGSPRMIVGRAWFVRDGDLDLCEMGNATRRTRQLVLAQEHHPSSGFAERAAHRGKLPAVYRGHSVHRELARGRSPRRGSETRWSSPTRCVSTFGGPLGRVSETDHRPTRPALRRRESAPGFPRSTTDGVGPPDRSPIGSRGRPPSCRSRPSETSARPPAARGSARQRVRLRCRVTDTVQSLADERSILRILAVRWKQSSRGFSDIDQY